MPEDTRKMDVAYVAHLARLQLTDEEMAGYAAQLGAVLVYIGKLAELDVTGIEPTAHATPLMNVWRADEVQPSIDRAEVLRNAPQQARDLFIVPKIIE